MARITHTPGPWRIAGKGTIRAGEHSWIASIHWRNREDNARLVAAAPDLLEAAQTARAHLITLGGDPRTVIAVNGSADGDQIQAAILDLIDAALAKAADAS